MPRPPHKGHRANYHDSQHDIEHPARDEGTTGDGLQPEIRNVGVGEEQLRHGDICCLFYEPWK